MAHRCACRLRMSNLDGPPAYDECPQYVEVDDQPYCDACIHSGLHDRQPNFDPVPSELLPTLRLPTQDTPQGIKVIGMIQGDIGEILNYLSIEKDESG
jgi:hypothetical protein